MKIYYAPHTRAVRIVWLFEELGLPYDLERFKLIYPRQSRGSAYEPPKAVYPYLNSLN